jgi:nucleotide-binding universal stress UspA family protein
MSTKRRSYEAGHKRKYLVVIDDTEECDRAVYWAAKRAGRTKSQLVMLRVIDTGERNQQWLGVADIMKAEANEEAKVALDKATERAKKIAAKIKPERVVREGDIATEILALIESDEDIALLVLGAGIAQEGPGPLVASLTSTAGAFPIPVAIVPGHLSDEDIDALA